MPTKVRVVVIGISLIALGGCAQSTVCTVEGVGLVVTPSAPSITVGQTVTLSGQAVWCGGHGRRNVPVVVATADTAILLVGATRTEVTGRSLGTAHLDVSALFDADTLRLSVDVRAR